MVGMGKMVREMRSLNDTIVAISTPLGRGGIGVIRISGPDAIFMGKSIFRPARPDLIKERRLSFGRVVGENGETVDQAMTVYIKAPHTYTGQDTYEIQAHGGNVVLEEIVELCLERGARLAEAGEFTYRAFMAGKMDVSQAEGVVELINAKTPIGSKIAVKQITGALKQEIGALNDEIKEIYADVEVRIEFIEEDMGPIDYLKYEKALTQIINNIDGLIKNARIASSIKNGIRIVLAGRVNAGKSSLMNKLCRHERAIVSERPGTTRDYLEAEIDIGGMNITLVDTAGLRQRKNLEMDQIEIQGQKITEKMMAEEQLIIYLIDSSKRISMEEKEIINKLDKKKALIVYNKIDLRPKENDPGRYNPKGVGEVRISAKTGEGVDKLTEIIKKKVIGDRVKLETITFLPGRRHLSALKNAKRSLVGAKAAMAEERTAEIVLIDLKEAMDRLGVITGENLNETVLDQIFNKFCIGK